MLTPLLGTANDILVGDDEPQLPEEAEEGAEDTMTQDDSLYCFRQHSGDCQTALVIEARQHFVRTGAVFSVAMDPAGALVCSGGEDDRAYVWKPEDGSVLFECTGKGR